jgi:hypothetical protein
MIGIHRAARYRLPDEAVMGAGQDKHDAMHGNLMN